MQSGIKVMTWWDPAFEKAVHVVVKAGKCSPEIIMKNLKVGYCRADFLLQILQRIGIVSQSQSRQGTYRVLKKQRES